MNEGALRVADVCVLGPDSPTKLAKPHSLPPLQPVAASMSDLSQVANRLLGKNQDTGGVDFWTNPERAGWLMKQGDRALRRGGVERAPPALAAP